MVLDSWVPKQSLTLVKNPDYKGDLKPNVDKIVVRFISDAQAQVNALRAGDVDIITPPATADTVASLQSLSNVSTLVGDQFSYDHLDLSFTTPVFKDAKVREAFLKVVPRQQILDAIITPLNPGAQLDNSQVFFPGTAGYDATLKVNGADAFDSVDVGGAKSLLAGAKPEVRILYNTKNPNRVAAFHAIQASAEKAGFTIVDAGSENWGALLGGASYDAAIFGRVATGVGVAGIGSVYGTRGGNNFNGYTNAGVDTLVTQLQATLDVTEQDDVRVKIDTLLWQDFYGVPLFVAQGVIAHGNAVTGVVYRPGQAGVGWNYWEWAKK